MRSERDVTAALRQAAESAPEPPDLLAVLGERRRRRTRQRYRTALAVAGVVAVAVGGTAVVRSGQHTTATVGDLPSAMTTATPSATVVRRTPNPGTPAREVWPEAVFTMPKKAADGFRYRPVTALSPTEILVTAESSFEKAGRLEVLDLESGTSRVVTEMVPHGKGYYEQNFEVGRTQVAWHGNMGEKWVDFWVAPLAGGRPVRAGKVTGALADVETIGVSEDHVMWSPKSGGVYRIPIAGGAPEKMPDTDGLHLLAWPWAADVPTNVPPGESGDENQSLLVNLETGERRDVRAPDGVTRMRCSLEWCTARSGDSAVELRPDGSDLRKLPGQEYDRGLFGGRFAWGSVLYDLATGRSAAIGARSEDGALGSVGQGVSSSPTSVFYWNSAPLKTKEVCHVMTAEERKDLPGSPSPGAKSCQTETEEPGDTYDVLNLAAIPKE